MRQCKQCGATFFSGETVCAYCGEPLVPGAKRREPDGGRRRDYTRGQTGRQNRDYSSYRQRPGWQSETPPPINMFRRSFFDTFIAVVLAVTFGWFGAHWFYLGNRRRGTWYAIFFWTGIPLILGLIDGGMLLLDAVRDRHLYI